MASNEGIYKATIQIGETESSVLFLLKGGRFDGFDLDDRRFRGTYREDPNTLDLLLTAELSYLTPVLAGQPRTRQIHPFTVRVPAPPDEVGVPIAADLSLDEAQGSVIIERLSLIEL
ncbi:hypothetical protein [Dyella sp. Tek66A03]|uniref:hypothetical protein n=1 Tax=Dyella sp. Tek66A03 TaxID=3458298 RepID=UPI00403E5E44